MKTSIFYKMRFRRWWKHQPTVILDRYYRMQYHFSEWFKKTFYGKIYYSHWSRDCDMCESAGVSVFYGTKKMFDKAYDQAAEWADGPFSWEIISKEEYLERKGERYFRDRVMEAYENGNGTSIYV